MVRRIGLSRRHINKLFKNGSVVAVLFLSSFCEVDAYDELTLLPYAGIESIIRNKYDQYSMFRWEEYTKILDILSQDKFKVMPLNEMRDTHDDSKVIVGLRHDVDFNPFKALEMAKIEKIYGIRSTFYFLATAEYYGSFINSKMVRSPGIDYLFKEIFNTGSEIGIHSDLIAVMILYQKDPFTFNREELEFYKSIHIPIYGTAAHGSPITKSTAPNYQIFSDFSKTDSVSYLGTKYPLGRHSLKDYGFEYEAYAIDYKTYYSDSGGKWNDPEGLSGILNKLENSKPGDRIQILAHPDWWGKTN